MSTLYNALFGVNPAADMLLGVLGLTRAQVPRFRDCYWSGEEICIYTRTGGGNRAYYESESSCRENYPEYFKGEPPTGPWNDNLRMVPGYIRDEDDDFDSTYATFYFTPPSHLVEALRQCCVGVEQTQKMSEVWATALARIKSGNPDDPLVKRATDAFEPVFAAIKSGLEPKE